MEKIFSSSDWQTPWRQPADGYNVCVKGAAGATRTPPEKRRPQTPHRLASRWAYILFGQNTRQTPWDVFGALGRRGPFRGPCDVSPDGRWIVSPAEEWGRNEV